MAVYSTLEKSEFLFSRITTQKTDSEEETNISDVGISNFVKEEEGQKEEETFGSKE